MPAPEVNEDLLGQLKEVEENLDKKQQEGFQKLIDTMEGRFKESEGSKAELEEKLTDALAKSQEDKDRIDRLEKALSRPGVDFKEEKEVEAAHKKAFTEFMRTGNEKAMDSFMQDIKGTEYEEKQLATNDDPNGGYFVRPEISSNIIQRVFESSPVRQFATVQTIGSKSIIIPVDDDEAGSGWVGETETRSETDTPEVREIEITARELSAEPHATQSMLDDAGFNIEQWLQGKVSKKFARDEATAFITGASNKRPVGFTTYDNQTTPGTYEFGKIEQVNSGSAGAVTVDGLIDTQGALLEEYQANARWMMQRATFNSVRKLKVDSKYALGIGFDNLGEKQQLQLLGKPVHFANDMPAIASAAKAIVYADFSEFYMIVDRMGIRVIRDALTTKGRVKFYTTKRVGGDVVNFQAGILNVLSA